MYTWCSIQLLLKISGIRIAEPELHMDDVDWHVDCKLICMITIQNSLHSEPVKGRTKAKTTEITPIKGTSRARFCILHNVWKPHDNRAYTGYRQPKLNILMKDMVLGRECNMHDFNW